MQKYKRAKKEGIIIIKEWKKLMLVSLCDHRM